MPADVAASDLVHNGWIQALVDGGLLLAIPVVVVGTAIPAWRSLSGGFFMAVAQVPSAACRSVSVRRCWCCSDTHFSTTTGSTPPCWRSHADFLLRCSRGEPGRPPLLVVHWAALTVIAVAGICGLVVSVLGTSVRFPDGEPPRWLSPGQLGRQLRGRGSAAAQRDE